MRSILTHPSTLPRDEDRRPVLGLENNHTAHASSPVTLALALARLLLSPYVLPARRRLSMVPEYIPPPLLSRTL